MNNNSISYETTQLTPPSKIQYALWRIYSPCILKNPGVVAICHIYTLTWPQTRGVGGQNGLAHMPLRQYVVVCRRLWRVLTCLVGMMCAHYGSMCTEVCRKESIKLGTKFTQKALQWTTLQMIEMGQKDWSESHPITITPEIFLTHK